ncbi:protein kinase [Clostridium sp. KNHs214]|nr:protein kinase [Clostridium sp. KNHs214]
MSEYKGKIIDGRYKLIEILGKGGMSVVYKAVSINFEKNWAVKEITLNKNADIDFLAEPNILKNLDHPALPRIVDIINEEEKIYI